MSGFLSGRVALVRGATSGIGVAVADALAGHGADLMIDGFGEADAVAATVADLAGRHGVRVLHDGSDLTDGAAVRAMVAACEAELGRRFGRIVSTASAHSLVASP